MKKNILLLLVAFSVIFNGNSQTASDTLDIYKTTVFIDIVDISVNNVIAESQLETFIKNDNTNSINFDLTDDLIVDSVKIDGQLTSYTHSNQQLKVNFISPAFIDDSLVFKIFYHGMFEQDPNGFGGNFFSNTYAYNVGVSLSISPHSYGRAWHPCFDNFVEKSAYTIAIKCDSSLTSVCTGMKILDSVSFDKRFTTWELPQPISSYLAGFSVSDYETLQWEYVSPIYLDTTPVIIGAKAADTQNVKLSFQNLNFAVETFESRYGEYQWDRIGYVMTPFPYGAMEHATNIVYPLATVAGGSLQYETLYAHELAHHWWGDYITCKDSKEMWINEGSARFSEFVFLEGLYGQNAYKKEVFDNHYDVLLRHHIVDSGYYAIANVPENFTYGETTYNKGAHVLYNLRGYLGDSLFFLGLRGVLDSAKWDNLSSLDFQNYMGNTIGVDLSDFFNGWVFEPGFPDFDIDSYNVTGTTGNYSVNLEISQQLRGLNVYHQNVPLTVTLVDGSNNEVDYTITASGVSTPITLSSNFIPQTYFLNKDRKINYATTVMDTAFSSIAVSLNQVNFFTLKTYSSSYSVGVRVENHWVAPRGNYPIEVILSKDRYWHIDGNMTPSEPISFTLEFNTLSSNKLDDNLKDFIGNSFTEDSLVLMYRPTPNDNWQYYPEATINFLGNTVDGYARILADSIIAPGQFTFGYRIGNTAGIGEYSQLNEDFIIYPNPVIDQLKIGNIPASLSQEYEYYIIDEQGKVVQKGKYNSWSESEINVSALTKGIYFLKMNNQEIKLNKKFVKE